MSRTGRTLGFSQIGVKINVSRGTRSDQTAIPGPTAAKRFEDLRDGRPIIRTFKDGDMLVLTVTRFENGKPIWAVVALTLDGETMKFAQMLEASRTIKRGSGKKQ